MRTLVRHHLDHDDAISARLEKPGAEVRNPAAVSLGTCVAYMTLGQAAALRDALDRMLSGEAPGPPPEWEADYGMPVPRG